MWIQSYATVVHNTRSSRPHCIVSVNYVLSEQECKHLRLNEAQMAIKAEPVATSTAPVTPQTPHTPHNHPISAPVATATAIVNNLADNTAAQFQQYMNPTAAAAAANGMNYHGAVAAGITGEFTGKNNGQHSGILNGSGGGGGETIGGVAGGGSSSGGGYYDNQFYSPYDSMRPYSNSSNSCSSTESDHVQGEIKDPFLDDIENLIVGLIPSGFHLPDEMSTRSSNNNNNNNLMESGNRNSIIMSNDSGFEAHHQHHQSPEFAVNYSFGEQSLMAGPHHHHHHHHPFETHPGVQSVHAESLFNSPTNSNAHHSLYHNQHLLVANQSHHQHNDLHGGGSTEMLVEGFSNKLLDHHHHQALQPQYTSVIVEPQAAYQMANEYVH